MTNKIQPVFIGLIAAATVAQSVASTVVINFEDVPVPPGGFYNGSDGNGKFTSSGVDFNNSYDDTFVPYWEGFAASSVSDTTTPGSDNQYAAYPGSGVAGSSNYAVGYTSNSLGGGPPTAQFGGTIDLGAGGGAWLTNTTYAALSMRDGDGFAKQFGGASGDDEDWFLLTIEGFDGVSSTGIIEFYLADFRFSDNSQDYILDEWVFVDFSSLGEVDSLQFSLTSSDTGGFGMNTPGYFAMDNLTIPEPTSLSLIALSAGLVLRRRRA